MRLYVVGFIFALSAYGQTRVDWSQIKGGPYYDLRQSGAKCDGATNVQPAVTSAYAAGYRHFYLAANCVWIPTANTLPNGISVMGENWNTSKIWPTSPASNFLTMGTLSVLQNVNLNGPNCNQQVIGCPVSYYSNTEPLVTSISNFPYNAIFANVGLTDSGSNDTNGLVVIQHGNGGGVYGQMQADHIGGLSGSGIHALQATAVGDCNGCAALRSTKQESGTGFVLDTNSANGGTGTDMQFASAHKTSGTIFDIFHSTAAFVGTMFHANLGSGGGSFTGNFESYAVNNTNKWVLDQTGNFYHTGIEAMAVGGNQSSAGGVISASAPMFHVTGSSAISTINPPAAINVFGHCFRVLPDGAFTTTTGANIAVATTAVVGKVMQFCYDPGTSKYYPSY